MPFDTSQLKADLGQALKTFDWQKVRRLSETVVAEVNQSADALPADAARDILSQLRRKKRFAEMQAIADALLEAGSTSAAVRRQYGQSLIDRGQLAAARVFLQSIVDDPQAEAAEKTEALGLLGRIAKQAYVNAGDLAPVRKAKELTEAIARYAAGYQAAPEENLWHGINWVALTRRARLDGVAAQNLPDENAIARRILGVIEERIKRGRAAEWDLATALEAWVALGDLDKAREFAVQFVAHPDTDAFEIASAVRQLQQVWKLESAGGAAARLINTLRSELLRKEGGEVELTSAEARDLALEKVYGDDSYLPVRWLQTGLQRCLSVAQIENRASGRKIGTGFVVKADDFFPDRKGQTLLITNHHVVSPDGDFNGSLAPEQATVFFELANLRFEVDELVATSPPLELDYSFLTVPGLKPEAVAPLECSFRTLKAKTTPPQRLYVIGYPKGGQLAVSLHDSLFVDTNGTYLHYRTPTDPGSSGSPVFDHDAWSVVGLHHAGQPYAWKTSAQANEGIALKAIRDKLKP